MQFKSALRAAVSLVLTVILALAAVLSACGEDKTKLVEVGDQVQIQYKGTLPDGTVFDQSQEGQPLEFTVGGGDIIPGFDKAVTGMKLNEQKTFTIPAAEAYGETNPEMVRNFPRSSFPDSFEAKEGETVGFTDPMGRQHPGKIVTTTPDSVLVDLNHPMAGKDLTFEVTVAGIVKKTAEGEAPAEGQPVPATPAPDAGAAPGAN